MDNSGGQQESHRTGRPARLRAARTLAEAAWFPAALFLGFLLCFAPALHAPVPHHAHVAVADPVVAHAVGTGLERRYPAGFDVSAVPGAEQARRAVLDRDAVAGYAGGSRPVLYVAGANGASLKQALTKAFTPVAEEHGGHPLTVRDVAPTVHQDLTGSTLVYFGIAWSVPGYILATTLLRATAFDRRKKFLAILVVSALFGAVGFLAGAGLGYLPFDAAALLVAFLLTTAVATFSSGLAPFTRQFFPAVGMTLFIVLSIPTSGGPAPAPLLPAFFQYVHAVMPLGNAVDALRSLLYFDGAGALRPLLVLCAWIGAGAALLALDARLHRRRASALRAAAKEDGADGEDAENVEDVEGIEDVEEPPVTDPSLETPTPVALPVHRHHFGDPVPDLVGTVRDAEQRPLRHAVLTVLDPSGRHLVSTTTNARGEFAVTGLPEDCVSIVATSPGRQPVVHRKVLRSGEIVSADFTLRERHRVPRETVSHQA
ncbi:MULTISPECIES: carboxypeptidase regulatory-like domain-containing protein [Streptomyces]|uniref:Carboxypeptidase regulatory-like domain-containing protein n=1 Tax=Streptomyces ramulosus TaxID=47762 RepID=A0ABW1FS79_9ACTN